MTDVVRTMPWRSAPNGEHEPLLTREWLVTNGLGGYASGTISGAPTRRYHGLLIAAMPAPLGRVIMLNHLSELLRLPDGTLVLLGGEERVPHLKLHGASYLQEFRLEMGLPVWRYAIREWVVEKRLFMPRHQNTVHIVYRMVEGKETVRLKLLPGVHFRRHDDPVSERLPGAVELRSVDDRFELLDGDDWPTLRMTTYGNRQAFTIERQHLTQMLYRIEESRGYESVGDLWSPGYFRFDLSPAHDVTIVASTERWEDICSMSTHDALEAEMFRRRRLLLSASPGARRGIGAELVLAADQFIIQPVGRLEDLAIAQAQGDEGRTVIAGYHWFTDWGRDTMISLEGLTLTTGRQIEAGYILRTFAHYVRDGLIPNLFPEGAREGLYHTADATLWFFHALDRYLHVTEDEATLRLLLPRLIEIVERHIHGTRFHIGADPADGLLKQGEEGYQLTWMDAKVGDWVVTPRRGKAVEINALWYNAVKLLEGWVRATHGDSEAARYAARAAQIRKSFNERFWNAETGYLYDVIDGERGNDPACRPNQIFAISLPHAVLDETHWTAVLGVVQKRLLTPVGLRSLAPGDPDYKPTYHGDLRTRDAAYHQGTVWAWLMGPFVDAWLKVRPDDRAGARKLLDGLCHHLDEACLGSVSEVFDAETPYTPRGCCAQAWSVAELLRLWVKTEPVPTA
jgi:predicted glycogen debranching enzyme